MRRDWSGKIINHTAAGFVIGRVALAGGRGRGEPTREIKRGSTNSSTKSPLVWGGI